MLSRSHILVIHRGYLGLRLECVLEVIALLHRKVRVQQYSLVHMVLGQLILFGIEHSQLAKDCEHNALSTNAVLVCLPQEVHYGLNIIAVGWLPFIESVHS